jgi:hypothetical protein
MAMYSFVPPFHEVEFVVCRFVSDKLVCAAGEASLWNIDLSYDSAI